MNASSPLRHPRRAAAVVAAGALLLAGCPKASPQPEPTGPAAPAPAPTGPATAATTGSWVEVRRGPLAETVPAVGSLRARQSTEVGAEVGGEIDAVLVDVGDWVKTDQELVRLDPTFFQLEVDQRTQAVEGARARAVSAERAITTSRADVARAEAALAEADLALERMRNLWKKPNGQAPSIPKSRYDQAVFGQRAASAALEAARSRTAQAEAGSAEAAVAVRQAEQALAYARERLTKTVVRSPFDGVVTRRMVDAGEPVTSTPVTHLVEVQEVRELYLEFSLPQELLDRVQAGTAVTFRIDGTGEAPRAGEVATVYPALDEATRSLRCRVVVPNEPAALAPGSLVQVEAVVRTIEEALVVPRAALERDGSGWVLTVERGGARERRTVEVGLVTADEAQILSGVEPGDRVLVRTVG